MPVREGKTLGLVNGLSQTLERKSLLLLLRGGLLLCRGLFLGLRLRRFSLHWHVCLLAEIGCEFRAPLITGTSSSATHHPHGPDYMEGCPSGQQSNAILEIFF